MLGQGYELPIIGISIPGRWKAGQEALPPWPDLRILIAGCRWVTIPMVTMAGPGRLLRGKGLYYTAE